MAPLFTTGQSRWALELLLACLSGIAIVTSAPSSVGGVKMLTGQPGDVRGVQVLIGGIALGSILVLRTGYMLLPKPWRVYLDRIEFAIVSMLWIGWTSATMAFSAFTLSEGVCSTSLSDTYLPNCPLLTLDMVLLHLLSITALALLLVILSTALSPHYFLAHSPLASVEGGGTSAKGDPESTDAFVMWELALASPPASPRISGQPTATTSTTYGTVDTVLPNDPPVDRYPQPGAPSTSTSPATSSKRKDKFAEGRVWSYIPLLLCSILASTACIMSFATSPSKYTRVLIFPIIAASISSGFTTAFLVRHWKERRQNRAKGTQSFMTRHDRALETGMGGVLFLLWPLAAIVVTLFPPTINRPCTNPAESFESPDEQDLPDIAINLLCMTTTTMVALAWLASWIILFRVMGLVVPLPEVGGPVMKATSLGHGEEAQSLLRSQPVHPESAERPQMQWGRMVAGEAFELGDAEEDE